MAQANVSDVQCGHILTALSSEDYYNKKINRTTAEEILAFLVSNGTINIDETSMQLMQERRKKYLEKHQYAIFYDAKNDYWRSTLPDTSKKDGRHFIKKRKRSDLENAIIDFYIANENKKVYTVESAMKEFIDYHYDSESKQPSKRKALYDYKRFFANIGKRSIIDMDEHAWQLVLEDIVKKQHPKHSAFSNACCLLRMTLRYLKKRDRIKLDINSIFDELELNEDSFDNTTKTEESQVFTYEEAQKLVSYLWEHRDNPRNLMLLLIYATGIRIGEASTLKHSDVGEHSIRINRTMMGNFTDDDGKNVKTHVKESPKTKAGKRTVVLSAGADKLIEAVRNLNSDSEYIFLNEKGQLLSNDAIRCHLYKICEKKLGMPKRTTHSLRKTYASILDESGMEDSSIIRQMGHSSIAVTKRFYIKNRRDEDAMREKLNDIPDLDISRIIESVTSIDDESQGTQGTQTE